MTREALPPPTCNPNHMLELQLVLMSLTLGSLELDPREENMTTPSERKSLHTVVP